MRNIIGALLLLVIPLSLSARPAPSYFSFERYRLTSGEYTLVLTDHIWEYRPIYQTIKILNGANEAIAEFRHCTETHYRGEAVSGERVACEKDAARTSVHIQYGSPNVVDATWENEGVHVVFSNH